jgi:hypothetical protein
MLQVNEETNEKMETAETRFLRAVGGLRMREHKRSNDIREGSNRYQ